MRKLLYFQLVKNPFERDKFLHSENAVIIRLDDQGNAEFNSLEAEYIPIGLNPREDLYEIELKREVRYFGNIAQVWSAFEIRTDREVPTITRGLNSIQLHYENDRWYIDSWTMQMESGENPAGAWNYKGVFTGVYAAQNNKWVLMSWQHSDYRPNN